MGSFLCSSTKLTKFNLIFNEIQSQLLHLWQKTYATAARYRTMKYKTGFQFWLLKEGKDIFGFEKNLELEKKNPEDEKPIIQFNVEEMMGILAMHSLGAKQPYIRFSNEIHWGKGHGAMRLWMGTGLNIMIERQGIDLNGTPRWICKRLYQIDPSGYGGYEDAVAEELLEQLNKIDETPLDSPSKEYDDLEGLVASMAASIRRTCRDIFIFEGIRKIDQYNYIIRLALRGHGIEAPDQQRVEENQTHVSFDKNSGVIRILNYNLESSKAQHEWAIMPTDTDLNFFPTQTREEIVETIANTLHWY